MVGGRSFGGPSAGWFEGGRPMDHTGSELNCTLDSDISKSSLRATTPPRVRSCHETADPNNSCSLV